VDNRRLLLFFLISLAILLGWQFLMPAPVHKPGAPVATPAPTAVSAASPAPSAPATVAATPVPTGAAPAPTPPAPPIAGTREEQLDLDTEEFRAVFTNKGAQLVSFQVKEHRDDKGQPLELVRARPTGPWPLGLVDAGLKPLPLDDAIFAARRERDAEGHEALRFDYRGPAGKRPQGGAGARPRPAGPRGGGLGTRLGPGARSRGSQPGRQGARVEASPATGRLPRRG
jgi:YidC/Oxa1 family membrane protein insertase